MDPPRAFILELLSSKILPNCLPLKKKKFKKKRGKISEIPVLLLFGVKSNFDTFDIKRIVKDKRWRNLQCLTTPIYPF